MEKGKSLKKQSIICVTSLILLFVISVFGSRVNACSALSQPFIANQPSGQTFTVTQYGDEYFSYHVTPSGDIVTLDADGYWHYTVAENIIYKDSPAVNLVSDNARYMIDEPPAKALNESDLETLPNLSYKRDTAQEPLASTAALTAENSQSDKQYKYLGTQPDVKFEFMYYPYYSPICALGRTYMLHSELIDTTNQSLVWSSEDPSIADVDSNGKVTGRSIGNTKITVKTLDGKYTASAVIYVVPSVSSVMKMNTDKAVVNNSLITTSDFIYINNKAMISIDSLQTLLGAQVTETPFGYEIIMHNNAILIYNNSTIWKVTTHNRQILDVEVSMPVQIVNEKVYMSVRDICTCSEMNLHYILDLSGGYLIITNYFDTDTTYFNTLLESAKPYFDDYGNTFDTAYQLEFSPVGTNTVNGILDYTDDIDMFEFTAPVTGTYTIYSSDITPDLMAYLYDSNQVQIAEDDNSGNDRNFKITASLTEGQTYFLKVSCLGENGMGDYTVNFEIPMDVLILKYNSPYSVFNGNKIENIKYSDGYAALTLNQGVSMISVRFLCEVANLRVTWDESKQTVIVTNPSTGEYLYMMVDNRTVVKYSLTGEKLDEWELPMAPQVINGITMIPLRTVSECLGYYVEYVEKDYGIYIIISSIPQTENVDMLCEMAKRLEI